MALTSTSTKNLLNEYHRLAADTLLGQRNSHLSTALLAAAEEGQYERIQSLLSNPNASLDARCPLSGDTPLIAAARQGHEKVVELLVQMGADLTLTNDAEESALEVASKKLRKLMLKSVDHEGRTMSNAQALLHNAWLGDAVSVKKHLSGNHYLDVNCSNNDGMTPLLLVTRDINLFDSIQTAMESEYNPVNVVQDLIDNHADINKTDSKGRNALHFVAASESVHARKMVSLLMRRGSHVDTLDAEMKSPLHIASGRGHTAIIIALVEEGGADVNSKGGERNDTPLMLTARAGHSEAARYLIAKGADVTAVDDNGDSALSVAATNSMVCLLKEAWTEQSKNDGKSISEEEEESPESSPTSSLAEANQSPLSSQLPSNRSFFLTDQDPSESFDAPLSPPSVTLTKHTTVPPATTATATKLEDQGSSSTLPPPVEEDNSEADDELDSGDIFTSNRPIKFGPASRNVNKRHSVDLPLSTNTTPSHEKSLPRSMTTTVLHSRTYSDSEVRVQKPSPRKGKAKEGKQSSVKKGSSKSRPLELPLSRSRDNKTHYSHVTKGANFLPSVMSSSQATPPQSPRPIYASAGNKLPTLNNMQPIAMVAVDTDQDRLKVQNFGESAPPPKPANRLSVQRGGPFRKSKSMMPLKVSEMSLGGGRGVGRRRRDKSADVHPLRRSDPNPPNKATLMPNVVMPQLGLYLGPSEGARGSTQAHTKTRGRGRLQSLNKPLPLKPLARLSESPPERTQSYPSLRSEDDDSKHSTLKASSTSEFETDSLERSGHLPLASAVPPAPTVDESPLVEAQLSNLFPPTPGTAHHQPNLMINYARQEGTAPLSPIWNRMPHLGSDSESSEYITSYIGTCSTPSPRGEECVKRVGADSGHGESSEDEGSSDESDPEEKSESLRWKRGRLLGKGAYGKVWEGLLDSAQLIAVKEVELDFVNLEKAQSQYEKIQTEVEILRSLRHRNVVSYLGTSLQEGLVFIFMEYISGGSLQSVLRRFGPLDYRTVAHYTRQICRALVYLHSNGIIHRDVKGANVMVTSKGVVKLIDFGCAKRYCVEGGATGMHSVRGTPYWMSPEVICGHGYGRKSDVWSLGCTVHEMAISKPPWADFPPESALFQIGIGKALPELPGHLSPVLVNFIHRCLTREQMERPTTVELLEDPFLANHNHHRRGSSNS